MTLVIMTTYNIKKCDITNNKLYLYLVLLIIDFIYNNKLKNASWIGGEEVKLFSLISKVSHYTYCHSILFDEWSWLSGKKCLYALSFILHFWYKSPLNKNVYSYFYTYMQ
jgi:hypothetical protein